MTGTIMNDQPRQPDLLDETSFALIGGEAQDGDRELQRELDRRESDTATKQEDLF